MSLRVCTLTLLSWISVAILVTQGMPNCVCKDNLKECAKNAPGQCDGKYKPWAMKNCRLSCNLCDEDPVRDQTECKDFYTDCAKNVGRRELCDPTINRSNGNFDAETKCRKYCGLCDPFRPLPAGPPSSKPGKKSCRDPEGSVYAHQMEWGKGCSVCDCDDGRIKCEPVVCAKSPGPHCNAGIPTNPKSCCPIWECAVAR